MKICIPVAEYRGLDSAVYGHFGSAPCFVLADTISLNVELLSNEDRRHVHGACHPVKALAGAKPDAVLVAGIGLGAFLKLRQAGIRVYCAPFGSVADALRRFKAGELEEFEEETVCAGHEGPHADHCRR